MSDKKLNKTAALKEKDKDKVKKLWGSICGKSFASDMVKNYKPKGNKIDVVAKKTD